MKTLFEESDGTYKTQNNYLISDLVLSTETELSLGKYAMIHRAYLEQHKRIVDNNLLASGKLDEYLYEIEQTALVKLKNITKQIAIKQGVTELLKVKDQIQWVRLINNIKNQAEEIIFSELIYK
ncbi:MAG: TnpV protein [Clostridiaceae bacterium]|nr:TnpV protein [Clostridiaceae bacterium]